MDSTTTSSILSVVAVVVSVGGVFMGIINHRAIVSRCCGRRLDFSLDINDTRQPLPPSPPVTTPTQNIAIV
jgi:hypothetical protein